MSTRVEKSHRLRRLSQCLPNVCVLSGISPDQTNTTPHSMKETACELPRKLAFNYSMLAARVECVLVKISAPYYTLLPGAVSAIRVSQTMWSSES